METQRKKDYSQTVNMQLLNSTAKGYVQIPTKRIEYIVDINIVISETINMSDADINNDAVYLVCMITQQYKIKKWIFHGAS